MINLVPITNDNYFRAQFFLMPYEKSCCGLASRLKQYQNKIESMISSECYIIEDEENIYGIILAISKKIIMHCIPFLDLSNKIVVSENVKNEILSAIKNHIDMKDIYCISGEKNATNFLLAACEKNPKWQSDYELRVFDLKHENFCYEIKDIGEYEIVRCDESDYKNLLVLQSGYDIEEVIPPHEKFILENCIQNLKHNLKTQIIFALKTKDEYIGKAGTNALGFNYYQIGGVYTLSEHRSKGIATKLVQHLTNYIVEKNKTPVLFVKQSNDSAKAAYTHVGFYPVGEYKIIYF